MLIGEAAVRADNGRFVDVDSGGGAMRIFSLMNFNTIAKRMRGDFSDVTGKGVSFDKLEAKVAFEALLPELPGLVRSRPELELLPSNVLRGRSRLELRASFAG